MTPLGNTSYRHEELLYEEIMDLREKGWWVVPVKRKLPDAIAISPDRTKIVAIEVLGRKKRTDSKGKSKGYRWDGGKGVEKKRWDYGHFDDIIFVLFDRSGSDWKHRMIASDTWPQWTAEKSPQGSQDDVV